MNYRSRNNLTTKARQRALWRLKAEHPDVFEFYYHEELAKLGINDLRKVRARR